jgi:MarR family transcriptional regulator, organic hydroperoxide resistance regulator
MKDFIRLFHLKSVAIKIYYGKFLILLVYTNTLLTFAFVMKTTARKYSGCMYFVSNSLARKMEKLAITAWKPLDISPSHAYLLMLAIENPGVQPTELSDQLDLQPSTITRLIERLEEKKLLLRITAGKQTSVYATPKAKAIYPKMKQCAAIFTEKYFGILGKEQSEKLVQNMNRIADKLEA